MEKCAEQSEFPNDTTLYDYDSNDRLTGESSTRWQGLTRAFGYDGAYNRTNTSGADAQGTANAQSFSETIAGNSKNQIMSRTVTDTAGNRTLAYSYDDEGNRTSIATTPATGVASTLSYGYDSNDHLVAVSEQVGNAAPVLKMTAAYRADGLRAWKETAQGRTYFYYDGQTLLAETDENGATKSVNTYGADGLVSRRVTTQNGTSTRYYAFDPRGNLAARTDAAGVITDRPQSTGFGGTSIQGESVSTFAGQAGGYFDEETGLVLFGQRYYDQSTGTWINRDPIAEAGVSFPSGCDGLS